MEKIKAFIGHSFNDEDSQVVSKFLVFFNHLQDMQIPFEWEHAEKAEPAELSKKVLQKMEDKNTFIGICTKKEQVLSNITPKRSILRKNMFLIAESDFEFKTTDWIIQEIGCAIGKNMKIILLTEKGIRRPGGLQGNLEYIEFERNLPELCFNKISEMITNLLPKKGIKSDLIIEEELEQKSSDQMSQFEIVTNNTENEILENWTEKEFDGALIHSIFKKDETYKTKIIENFNVKFCKENITLQRTFEIKALYYETYINKVNNFQKILNIAKYEPNNAEINFYVGQLYNYCKEYNKARDYFVKASQNSKDTKTRMLYLCEAILTQIEMKVWDYDQIWNEIIELNQQLPDNLTLFEILTKIAKKKKNDFLFFMASEAVLNENPFNETVRFDLAYRYGELEKYDLTYFHYNVLTSQANNDTYWNNFGVAAHYNNLKAKSITNYLRSAELNGTLAMSNIAFKYLENGFIDDANKICEKALTIKEYDKNVASAIASTKTRLNYESEEETKILDKAKNDRQEYIKFANSYIKPNFKLKSKLGLHPKCRLKIEIIKNKFNAIGEFEKESIDFSSMLFPNIYGGIPNSQKETTLNKYILKIEGSILGHLIDAKYYEYISNTPSNEVEKSQKEFIMLYDEEKNKIIAYPKNTTVSDFEIILVDENEIPKQLG